MRIPSIAKFPVGRPRRRDGTTSTCVGPRRSWRSARVARSRQAEGGSLFSGPLPGPSRFVVPLGRDPLGRESAKGDGRRLPRMGGEVRGGLPHAARAMNAFAYLEGKKPRPLAHLFARPILPEHYRIVGLNPDGTTRLVRERDRSRTGFFLLRNYLRAGTARSIPMCGPPFGPSTRSRTSSWAWSAGPRRSSRARRSPRIMPRCSI